MATLPTAEICAGDTLTGVDGDEYKIQSVYRQNEHHRGFVDATDMHGNFMKFDQSRIVPDGPQRFRILRVEELDPVETVEHPAHYGGKDDPYEVIKVIDAWGLGFKLGNVVKYVARAGKKDPSKELEDLRKARFYINHRITELEG